jgi:hypothetical protein
MLCFHVVDFIVEILLNESSLIKYDKYLVTFEFESSCDVPCK